MTFPQKPKFQESIALYRETACRRETCKGTCGNFPSGTYSEYVNFISKGVCLYLEEKKTWAAPSPIFVKLKFCPATWPEKGFVSAEGCFLGPIGRSLIQSSVPSRWLTAWGKSLKVQTDQRKAPNVSRSEGSSRECHYYRSPKAGNQKVWMPTVKFRRLRGSSVWVDRDYLWQGGSLGTKCQEAVRLESCWDMYWLSGTLWH